MATVSDVTNNFAVGGVLIAAYGAWKLLWWTTWLVKKRSYNSIRQQKQGLLAKHNANWEHQVLDQV